jgi:hypothetical protein
MAGEIVLILFAYGIYLACRMVWKRRKRRQAELAAEEDRKRTPELLNWDELVQLHRIEKDQAHERHERENLRK